MTQRLIIDEFSLINPAANAGPGGHWSFAGGKIFLATRWPVGQERTCLHRLREQCATFVITLGILVTSHPQDVPAYN